MNRIIPLVLTGLLLAACGDSTDSNGRAPAGGAGSDSEQITPGSGPVGTTAEEDVEPDATEPIDPAAPALTDPLPTDSLPTDPPVSDPPATDPPPTDPPAPVPAAPTDRVVRFFAGGGVPDAPWAPLGHWDGTDWQDLRFSEDGTLVDPPASPIASVAVTTLDLPDGPGAVISGLELGVEQPFCVGEESSPLIALPAALPTTAASIGYNAVAVTADWPLQPRAVRQVGLEVPEYAEIGASFLPDGVDTAGDGTVVQAVRVDLDGDAVEEVLVTYEHQVAGDFGGDGDFSSIYVRYPSSDGSVVDQQLVSYVSMEPVDFPTPGRYTLAAVADLNGDGVMEVMVRELFWEAGGMQIFSLADGRLVRVAGGGCGV